MSTVSLIQTPRLQFSGLDGSPLAGGLLYVYMPATFTPATTYQDPGGSIANPSPIVLDQYGAASIWGSGAYRFILTDSLGNQVFDQQTTAPALSTGVLLVANNLSDVNNVATARTNLGLGTAAVVNTGTAGATLGLLNTANTVSGTVNYVADVSFGAKTTIYPPTATFTTQAGYRGAPIVAKSANYTLALIDAGVSLFFSATASATIPTNASIAFELGAIVDLKVDATFVLTVTASGGVTLRWPTGNVTGNRTVTGPGAITVQKIKTDEWWVVGGVNVS